MGLFQFKWLRKLIRKKTAPMPFDVASRGKQRLSFIYAFFAWNAFGLVLFQIFKGKIDWAREFKLSFLLSLVINTFSHFRASRCAERRHDTGTEIRKHARNGESQSN
jgi:hypothetical protein